MQPSCQHVVVILTGMQRRHGSNMAPSDPNQNVILHLSEGYVRVIWEFPKIGDPNIVP